MFRGDLDQDGPGAACGRAVCCPLKMPVSTHIRLWASLFLSPPPLGNCSRPEAVSETGDSGGRKLKRKKPVIFSLLMIIQASVMPFVPPLSSPLAPSLVFLFSVYFVLGCVAH